MDGRRILMRMKTTSFIPTESGIPYREPRLGIDIGRVLIAGGEGGDTAFFGRSEEEALETSAVVGAFDSVARLVPLFEGRVFLVSKCGSKIQRRSRAWLEHH